MGREAFPPAATRSHGRQRVVLSDPEPAKKQAAVDCAAASGADDVLWLDVGHASRQAANVLKCLCSCVAHLPVLALQGQSKVRAVVGLRVLRSGRPGAPECMRQRSLRPRSLCGGQ
mmetsp:Transcript_67393/g.197047  ORF Transcript_67393/g.197047 Transcript_67393/m.197047 type:complete len:116 (+) Transcript_67393:128-475(+)